MIFIIDLDQTLINSNVAFNHRKSRQWHIVYSLIPQMNLFPNIDLILEELSLKGIKTALVSSSPKVYCERVINHFNLRFDAILGYHDTQNHKPHPDPYLKAFQVLNRNQTKGYAIGDDPNDIIAAKRAGIKSIGCGWGSYDSIALQNSKPDFYCSQTVDLLNLIKNLTI